MKISRRTLFQTAAGAPLAAGQTGTGPAGSGRALNGWAGVKGRLFRGEGLREIAFPLGGIGTGTVSLGGYGNLRDWEIFNRPNKGGVLPFTFSAVRMEGGGLRSPLIRVLEAQQPPPFSGGFGTHREQALGLPRFRKAVFTGAYPFAQIDFEDARMPVSVSMEAFNPMIPLDEENSSLPVAVLSYRFTSRATSKLEMAAAFSAMNAAGYDGRAKLWGKISDRHAPFFGQNVNEHRREGGVQGILMGTRKYGAESPRYGSMAVATMGDDVTYTAGMGARRLVGRFPEVVGRVSGRGPIPVRCGGGVEGRRNGVCDAGVAFRAGAGGVEDGGLCAGVAFPEHRELRRGQGEDVPQ